MIELWYTDIEQMKPELFRKCTQLLPSEVISDVLRYRFTEDQYRKLIGRLMVGAYFTETMDFNWSDFSIQQNGKPVVSGGKYFSISHSGSYVVVAFSNDEIGVDIELQKSIPIDELLHHFHPEEVRFICGQSDKQEAFHRIWTRKEAFLKAKGTGLLQGTVHANCQPDQLSDTIDWEIRTLVFQTGYALSVCHSTPIVDIQITHQSINKMISSLNSIQ